MRLALESRGSEHHQSGGTPHRKETAVVGANSATLATPAFESVVCVVLLVALIAQFVEMLKRLYPLNGIVAAGFLLGTMLLAQEGGMDSLHAFVTGLLAANLALLTTRIASRRDRDRD